MSPAGSLASWHFNWGKTLAYELTGFQLLPIYVGPHMLGHAVDLKLTNLQPSTTYHYRLRAGNAVGSTTGSDLTFTTGSPGTPDPGGSGPDPETGGGGSGGGSGGDGAGTPIVLGKLGLTASRFRVGKTATALVAATSKARKKTPVGTTLKAKLSRDATLTIAVERSAKGRRKGNGCVKPSKAKRTAKRCTRWFPKGTLLRAGEAGGTPVAFSGRLGKKALKPARYRFSVIAGHGASASAPRTRSFTIVER